MVRYRFGFGGTDIAGYAQHVIVRYTAESITVLVDTISGCRSQFRLSNKPMEEPTEIRNITYFQCDRFTLEASD